MIRVVVYLRQAEGDLATEDDVNKIFKLSPSGKLIANNGPIPTHSY